jgi:DNA polymerase III sliding clamp (beta) subunit (PCNA family)
MFKINGKALQKAVGALGVLSSSTRVWDKIRIVIGQGRIGLTSTDGISFLTIEFPADHQGQEISALVDLAELKAIKDDGDVEHDNHILLVKTKNGTHYVHLSPHEDYYVPPKGMGDPLWIRRVFWREFTGEILNIPTKDQNPMSRTKTNGIAMDAEGNIVRLWATDGHVLGHQILSIDFDQNKGDGGRVFINYYGFKAFTKAFESFMPKRKGDHSLEIPVSVSVFDRSEYRGDRLAILTTDVGDVKITLATYEEYSVDLQYDKVYPDREYEVEATINGKDLLEFLKRAPKSADTVILETKDGTLWATLWDYGACLPMGEKPLCPPEEIIIRGVVKKSFAIEKLEKFAKFMGDYYYTLFVTNDNLPAMGMGAFSPSPLQGKSALVMPFFDRKDQAP